VSRETLQPSGARRPGEVAIDLPAVADAGVHFIGRIRTPFAIRADCPKNGRETVAEAVIEVDPRYAGGLLDIERCSHLIVLYWMDEARRDLVRQVPGHLGRPRGTFALRSPVRPNPIALSVVELLKVDGTRLTIRYIDCRDGTPLVDIKPYYATTDSIPDARRP
jgi:tRNA-Thr(GGU) m(6)t(6)A37 methyltransferase TsaA